MNEYTINVVVVNVRITMYYNINSLVEIYSPSSTASSSYSDHKHKLNLP